MSSLSTQHILNHAVWAYSPFLSMYITQLFSKWFWTLKTYLVDNCNLLRTYWTHPYAFIYGWTDGSIYLSIYLSIFFNSLLFFLLFFLFKLFLTFFSFCVYFLHFILFWYFFLSFFLSFFVSFFVSLFLSFFFDIIIILK